MVQIVYDNIGLIAALIVVALILGVMRPFKKRV